MKASQSKNWANILAEAGLRLKVTYGGLELPFLAIFAIGWWGEGLSPPRPQPIPDFYCMTTWAML